MTLDVFISERRDELIRRCRSKVAQRLSPPPGGTDIDRGVPLFLDQLVVELQHGPSTNHEIGRSAVLHGHDLLLQGFTVGQVVHDYGDICQSITDLALEAKAAISVDDFRTLNRCLDDAIAGAVSEFSRAQDVTRKGDTHRLLGLANKALMAFEVLQDGNVGVGGSTGTLVHRSLIEMNAILTEREPPRADVPERGTGIDPRTSAPRASDR